MRFIDNIKKLSLLDKHDKVLIKGAKIAFVGTALVFLTRFCNLAARTNILSASEVGYIALSISIITLLLCIGNGFNLALLHYASFYRGKESHEHVKGAAVSVYSQAMLIMLTLVILFNVFAKEIAIHIFHKPQIISLLRIISIAIVFRHISSLNAALLRSAYLIRYGYIVAISSDIITIIIFLCLFVFKKQMLLWAIAFLIATFIIMLFSFAKVKKNLPFIFDKKIKAIKEHNKIFKFAVYGTITGTLARFRPEMNLLIIALFLSPSEIALFNIALQVGIVATFILRAINSIFGPMVGNLYGKKDITAIKRLHLKTLFILALSSITIFLIYFFTGKAILGLFGEYYRLAFIPLLIISFSNVISSSVGSVQLIINMMNKPHINTIINLLALIIMLFLSYKLTPTYGIKGAAIAHASSIVLINIAAFLVVIRLYVIEKRKTA